MRRFTALVYFWLASTVGCASTWRPATGVGKARVHVCQLRRIVWPRVEVRRVAVVDNPSDDEVILDCHSMRVRVPAHLATDVLLMPGDTGCDLHADEDYSPNTGDSVPIPDVPIGVTVKATTNGGRP